MKELNKKIIINHTLNQKISNLMKNKKQNEN